jgi:hypothetical protein
MLWRSLEDEQTTEDVATPVEVTADVQAAPYWACDDTRTDCSPVCMQRRGLVTNKIGPAACGDGPKDECECAASCYYDVKWVCGDAGDVVCVAKQGKKAHRVVGDLLCSSRGTPKPERSEMESMESCEKAVNIGTLPKMDCLTPGAGAEDKRAEDKPQLMLYSGAIFARLLLALFVID